MEINDFLVQFKEQFIDSDDIKIDLDSNFRDIESYDSLTGMAILVMIKDNFNVDIADDQYKNLNSVREIFEFITKEKE